MRFFPLRGCCGECDGRARQPLNDIGWVAIGTPTDRPKSFRYRYVIEHFGRILMPSLCILWRQQSKGNIGFTFSVVCLSCIAYVGATCVPQNTGFAVGVGDFIMD